MKKELYFCLFLMIASINAKGTDNIIFNSSLGYCSFSRNMEKGLGFNNSVAFRIYKPLFINGSITFCNGFGGLDDTPFNYIVSSSSIDVGPALNLINYKKNSLFVKGGISIVIFIESEILREHYIDKKLVYEISTIGRIQSGYFYSLQYQYKINEKQFIGLSAGISSYSNRIQIKTIYCTWSFKLNT